MLEPMLESLLEPMLNHVRINIRLIEMTMSIQQSFKCHRCRAIRMSMDLITAKASGNMSPRLPHMHEYAR